MASKWWTLLAICTGVFMLLLDITIVNVALPDIQGQLDAGLSDLQWVVDAYALSLASLLLTAGSLADEYGRRRVFAVGTVLFTVGSVLCGSAQDVTFLSISRAAQGIGGAAMFACAPALLANAFQGKDRGTAFGLFGATTGVAVAIGPVLGGVLTSGLSWRWIFFVNIPVGAACLAITLLRVPESKSPRAGRPDWFGFVVFTAALASLVYGLIEAGRRGWGDGLVVGCFVACAVLLVVFVVAQLRTRSPMLDLSLLRKPTFTGGLIAAFGVSSTIFSLLTYLVIYVQNVLGYSPIQTGFRFLFLSAASFLAATLAGRLTTRVPAKWLIGPGFLVLAVGLWLMTGIEPSSTWRHLIPGLIVSGAALGFINTPLVSTAVGVVHPRQSGMASGINSTFRQVGVATGIAALGSIFSHEIADRLVTRAPSGVNAGRLADAITGGQLGRVLSDPSLSDATRRAIEGAATSSYVDALNHIVTIGAVGALTAGILCLILIRQKDFVAQGPEPSAAGSGAAGSEAAGSGAAGSESAGSAGGRHAADQPGVPPPAGEATGGTHVRT